LVSEILIYSEQDRLSVGLILTMKEFSLEGLTNAISKSLKTNMILCEKNNITQEKVYLSFKKKVEYDAVFGVSKSIKDGSIVSGDTHSITRISDEKFLVALSDGMGSGVNANSISSVSLSLIESFYKAGMNSKLILSTVNNLLSVNTEDSPKNDGDSTADPAEQTEGSTDNRIWRPVISRRSRERAKEPYDKTTALFTDKFKS
jgi:hypothetical protein